MALLLLLTYAVMLVLLGVWIGRRVRGTSDFFVAGRRLGPGLIFSTLLAANIGAGSTVGAAGLGYRDGISAWWWVGSAGLGSWVLAWSVGPRIRRQAAQHDLRTVGDYLELRYDGRVRGIVAVLLWIGSLAILAGQLIAIAWILNVVTGLPKAAGCVIGGAVVTLYFSAGGLMTSARVNVIQLTVKLAGFAVALPLALQVAGLERVLTTAPTADYWNAWRGGQSGWMFLPLLGPSFIVSPGLLQKLFGARDDRAVRLGVGANALALLLYAPVPVLLGIVARAQFPPLSSPDLALPTMFMHGVPAVVGGLGLAAVLSAEMSAADAVLFMLTTSLSQDLYKRFVNPAADDRRVLLVTRTTAVTAGALSAALAIVSASVIDTLTIFYTLLTVSLFVPIVAGLYVRRAGSTEALGAIAAGLGATLVAELSPEGSSLRTLPPALCGLLAAITGFAIVRIYQGINSQVRNAVARRLR